MLPNITNCISSQNAENGDPKTRNRDGPGTSRKFRVSLEFSQQHVVRGTPGNSFWGSHFGDLGAFSGEMKMAKVDVLRRGDQYFLSDMHNYPNILWMIV